MVETAQWNSVGNQSHPGKGSHHPEASFASSPAMAARSVNSQCRSRVIEPRNNVSLEPSPFGARGQYRNAVKGKASRSDRGLRARQEHQGFPGNMGDPHTSMGQTPEGCNRSNYHPGLEASGWLAFGSKFTSQPKVVWLQRDKRSCQRSVCGSLSGFVVPIESRRTEPSGAGE